MVQMKANQTRVKLIGAFPKSPTLRETRECRVPGQFDRRLASVSATHFSLCCRHRHVTPSHHSSQPPSSALSDWWLVSAAQPFLPLTERVEEKEAESRRPCFHFLLVGMDITHMSAERRGDDWRKLVPELSVKAERGTPGQPIKSGMSAWGACPPASGFGEVGGR